MHILTEDKIKATALSLFIQNGYVGTSLSDIGSAVGIKKQSIYTHFKNKEDLFLTVMTKVVNEEIHKLDEYFEEKAYMSLEKKLYGYVILLKDRFVAESEDNIKFLLRMMFVPPGHLKETVANEVMTYYSLLEDYVQKTFEENAKAITVEPKKAKLAYLNIFDGLLVELVYVDVNSFETRLKASWDVFKKGVFI